LQNKELSVVCEK
jgi:hypothetical protein